MAKPIDRQSTTPFHLKLFYRLDNFHHLSDFAISSQSSSSPPPPAPASGANLPAHLEIYTWQSCTLRELTQLLTLALPSLLPDPPVGTRLCYRLIYPDTKAAAMNMGGAGAGADVKGRYLSKDIGSVIVGPRDSRDNQESEASSGSGPRALKLQGYDADKTLQDMRFVIGDYVDCAVLPPLEDGSVAPPLTAGRGTIGGGGPGGVGGGMRAFRDTPGFGGRGGRGGGGGGRDRGFPAGEWKRGERLPEGGRGGRRGWAPY